MPLDAICLSALTSELGEKLTGGRIDKVQQPERDMLLISLRSKGENLRLLISAGTGSARVHLTKASFENPAEPPMFCMLMRKHLVGARDQRQSASRRGSACSASSLTAGTSWALKRERSSLPSLSAAARICIVVDAEGRITDCMRRMDFGGDALRRMLPGMIYRMPPAQTKPQILKTNPELRRALIAFGETGTSPLTNGCSTALPDVRGSVCRELAYRSGGYEMLPELLDAFCESVNAGEMRPYMLFSDGKPADFSFMKISQYGEAMDCEEQESFSALLDRFYSERDRLERRRQPQP